MSLLRLSQERAGGRKHEGIQLGMCECVRACAYVCVCARAQNPKKIRPQAVMVPTTSDKGYSACVRIRVI